MRPALPGAVNRGNAAQAVAAAVAMGADPAAAVAGGVGGRRGGGRYRTVRIGSHSARLLLAKNPAGWQEALSMVEKSAAGVVISVNGQVPDGEDLSWLWDVRFTNISEGTSVVAAGSAGTDLAVRLGYAGVAHALVHDTVAAIASCPPGHVEVVAKLRPSCSCSGPGEGRRRAGAQRLWESAMTEAVRIGLGAARRDGHLRRRR